MKSKGFIITVTALYFVILFLLFLSFTSSSNVKQINTDRQIIQNYNNIISLFVSDLSQDVGVDEKWCSYFFRYEAYDYVNNTDSEIIYIHYCEDYENKRFI